MTEQQWDLIRYMDEVERQLETVSEQIGLLSFRRFVDKRSNPEIARLEAQRADLILNPRLADTVDELLAQQISPRIERRMEVWRNTLLAARVNSNSEVMRLTRELNDAMVGHSYRVQGQLVDLGAVRGMLRGDPDQGVREAAFRSLAELSDLLEPKLLSLVELRNLLSRELGFPDYVALSIETNGMTAPQVEALLTELTEATDELYLEVLQNGADRLNLRDIAPWDVQYVLEQGGGMDSARFPRDNLKASLQGWLAGMGHQMADLGITPEFVDIPYNGLCMPINRKDIRILFNPQNGFAYYKTAFHELGHALHSALNRQPEYAFRRESGIFTEGVAEIFGYIPQHPEWLRGMGLGEQEITKAQTALLGPLFHYLRQRTAYCLFEHSLYRNTGQDLHGLMAQTESRILGCLEDGSPRWAANGWFISYPVYWHNYVIADVIASQIHHHLRDNVGELFSSREAFAYVIDTYIAPGASQPWLEKICQGTGKELKAEALIADLTGGAMRETLIIEH